jgi:hypothetical protein
VGYAQTCDYIGQIREEEGQDSRVGINRFQNLGFLLSLEVIAAASRTQECRDLYTVVVETREFASDPEKKNLFFFFSLCDVISRTQKRRSEQEE